MTCTVRRVPAAPLPDVRLGWHPALTDAWSALGRPGQPARVARVDRGWSTLYSSAADAEAQADAARVRNLGADVAVGDWVVASDDGEIVAHVLDRQSASQCTPLYDAGTQEWYQPWADVVAPDIELPRLAWAGDQAGVISDAAAAAVPGLRAGTPVAVGTIDAWAEGLSVGAVRAGLELELEVVDYQEHSLGAGADATAVAYVETKDGEGTVRWGVGTDPNIITASLKAVLGAASRAHR